MPIQPMSVYAMKNGPSKRALGRAMISYISPIHLDIVFVHLSIHGEVESLTILSSRIQENDDVILFFWITHYPIECVPQIIGLIYDMVQHEIGSRRSSDVVKVSLMKIEPPVKAFSLLVIVLHQSKQQLL